MQVWTGAGTVTAVPEPVPAQIPLTYTLPYLAEKILTHALRACYAALAMQTALRRYAETVRRTHGLEAQMRVGLNAGDVVVHAIGNDLYMEYSTVG